MENQPLKCSNCGENLQGVSIKYHDFRYPPAMLLCNNCAVKANIYGLKPPIPAVPFPMPDLTPPKFQWGQEKLACGDGPCDYFRPTTIVHRGIHINERRCHAPGNSRYDREKVEPMECSEWNLHGLCPAHTGRGKKEKP